MDACVNLNLNGGNNNEKNLSIIKDKHVIFETRVDCVETMSLYFNCQGTYSGYISLRILKFFAPSATVF